MTGRSTFGARTRKLPSFSQVRADRSDLQQTSREFLVSNAIRCVKRSRFVEHLLDAHHRRIGECGVPKKSANDNEIFGELLPGVGRQAIAGNPLTPEEIAMFEMFEREGWPPDRRRMYILNQHLPSV